MSKLSNNINILIMPTDICNMNCVYCFHNSHHQETSKMSLSTLKKLYDITLNEYSQVTFIWHGGEPLVMGLPFFQKAIDMQKEYSNVKIMNRIQSNLTLLSDDFADFLVENNIGLGSSLDGIKNEELRGNTTLILHNRQKLLNRGKNCGFIMVLSQKNVHTLIESYEMFKSIGANYNINPYVSTPTEHNKELLLNSSTTSKKLIEFYEYWKNDSSCNIEVGYFERIIKYILFSNKSVCKYNSCLGKWIGVRFNGDIVPCNRYFPNEYSYGNIYDYNHISEAFSSDGFKKLLLEAIDRRERCKDCSIFDFCSGGCNNVALNENGINKNMGEICKITITVYRHIFLDLVKFKCHFEACDFANPRIKSIMCQKNKH